VDSKAYNLVSILGHTAGGKTTVATHLAYALDGEIISGDSRQLYRGMDLGTGKDIDEYVVNGKQIPYHLIDIADAGYKYNVYEYQTDFVKAFEDIQSRGKFPVLCGGTGLYVEAVLKGYKLIHVPANEELRKDLEGKNLKELTRILEQMKDLHNTTDVETVRRAVRAIEIETYYQNNPKLDSYYPEINSLLVGVKFDRDSRRRRITARLKERFENGMLEEVKGLIDGGVKPEDLIYYGLEYKFITQHIIGELTYDEMFEGLNIAIHQFAKRQMTWYRKMERHGMKIHWLDGYIPLDEKIEKIKFWLSQAPK